MSEFQLLFYSPFFAPKTSKEVISGTRNHFVLNDKEFLRKPNQESNLCKMEKSANNKRNLTQKLFVVVYL
jgi:hypothetical protein